MRGLPGAVCSSAEGRAASGWPRLSASSRRAARSSSSATQAEALDPALEAMGGGGRRTAQGLRRRGTPAAGARSSRPQTGDRDGVSVLANNAGISRREPFLDITSADWQAILAVNLTRHVPRGTGLRPAAGARAGGPARSSTWPPPTPSAARRTTRTTTPPRVASLQLTRLMAVELGRHGIRVNALCPGYIDTPLNQGIAAQVEAGFGERYAQERIPLRRVGLAEEVAAAYAFLA